MTPNQSLTPLTDALESSILDYSWPTKANRLAEHARSLELKLQEVERIKLGYENNMPSCGACAEGIICGSVMHEHDKDCVYSKLKEAERQRDEAREDNHRFVEMNIESGKRWANDIAERDQLIKVVDELALITAHYESWGTTNLKAYSLLPHVVQAKKGNQDK